METHLREINTLLNQNNYPEAIEIKRLKSSGSERKYFRVFFKNQPSIVAAFNADISENRAWYYFTQHFISIGLPVPTIFAHSDDFQYFLLQDLGDVSLFELLTKKPESEIINYFKKAISALIRFQTEGIKGLDLKLAYPPVQEISKRTILWDLNYFKYYFVKPHEIIFDENKLENDFQKFAETLLKAESIFFLYRDFQSRNIMVLNDELFFIDFQAGRKGPLQYDLVSLLFQARINLKPEVREELLNFYLDELEKKIPGKRNSFLQFYHNFIYFRMMQVLGAYGFRGLIQKKPHFLLSIPYALENLQYLLLQSPISKEFEELSLVLNKISSLDQYTFKQEKTEKLTVQINSFSYLKSGFPPDETSNGGGFVFDCRALPNPGRLDELKEFSGLEKPVTNFLEKSDEIAHFLHQVFELVDQSIDNYQERKFNHLQVNFGCTGGKHRSVYCAEKLNKHLNTKYKTQLAIKLHHRMSEEW